MVDWLVSAHADPAMPEFVLVLRKTSRTHKALEVEAKSQTAFVVLGKGCEMKPYRASLNADEQTIETFQWGGPRSILEAVAGAKSAEIEFGGKRYYVAERGMANCWELLRRSEAAAKR